MGPLKYCEIQACQTGNRRCYRQIDFQYQFITKIKTKKGEIDVNVGRKGYQERIRKNLP